MLEMPHGIFSRNTRNQFRQVFEALRDLTALPEAAAKHPLGFVHPKHSKGPTGKLLLKPGLPRLGRRHRNDTMPKTGFPLSRE